MESFHCGTVGLANFVLNESLVRAHSQAGFVIVTFTNRGGAHVALNWARQLSAVNLPRSLIGLTEALDGSMLDDLRGAGAGFFCADSELARLDSAAGRWKELARLMRFGVDVLCSDADIAWLRDPLPYFRAVQRRHPTLDIALASDRVTLDFTSQPLGARYFASDSGGRTSASAGWRSMSPGTNEADMARDLGLEDAVTFHMPSYNVGIVMLFASRAAQRDALAQMLVRWTEATVTSPPHARKVKVDSWAQGPINMRVLRRGLRRDEVDPHLGCVFDGRLTLGVLPSLQFTTALTYFSFAPRRAELGVAAFCLHAIFSHGRDPRRKLSILRQVG
jgi:hypothetical protein